MKILELIDNDEEILFTVHKHWFALLGKIVMFVVSALAPIAFVILFNVVPTETLFSVPGNQTALSIAFIFIWLTFVLPFVFVVWTDHYLDSLVLTTNRIIEVEQKGLFAREVSSFRLDRVQDITTEITGVIPTMLNFGNLQIQTAGESKEFKAKYIPDPRGVKLKILREHDEAVERKFDRQRE